MTTAIVGKRMAFWREHMPAGMFLRSGPDWHLDPAHELTLERYLKERGLNPDPLPIQLFLDYADWFTRESKLEISDEHVVALRPGFEATLESGELIRARNVIAAPGIAHFTHKPEWAQDGVHTCDLTDFSGYDGANVLIVGGRQSAYEWAALAAEHGAQRIDVVHRHATPRFDKVSWRFVDPLIDSTLRERGWWRNGFPALDPAMQSSVPGLYLPGFTAAQDFGPFFGFVKGAPAAAQLIVQEIC